MLTITILACTYHRHLSSNGAQDKSTRWLDITDGKLKFKTATPTNRNFQLCVYHLFFPRNASRFALVFKRAEDLFRKLIQIKDQWEDRVALGSIDFEHIIRENLNLASDWDLNFRASKIWGQEIAKLSWYVIRKIDCDLNESL